MISILNVFRSEILDNIKIHLFRYPDQIENISQIMEFLKPITIDDIKCQPSKHKEENKKESRLRIPHIHEPASNIKWERDPYRIMP
jgi:hypothetical protein